MRKFEIYTYSATKDATIQGHAFPKGATTKLVIANKTMEELDAMKDVPVEAWAAAVFPVNAAFDAEIATANAKLLCNYLNKVAEAQEKARLGAEMGFLNY